MDIGCGPSIGMAAQRSSGGRPWMGVANAACAAASTGRCLGVVLAGYLPRKLSPFQFHAGLAGRGTKPPPQLGQTLASRPSTQLAQKVHSKLQIRASVAAGGSALLQCSQVGRSSSMVEFLSW